MRSVRRVVNEFDKDNQIVSPNKRNTPNPFPKVDGFDLDAIRRIVHYFYKANESPTLKKIHAAVKSQLNFPYGRENLRQILIKIGFRYRKRGRERIFYERGDIVSWREKYLRRIKQIREQEPERDIVYLDETWLTEGHQKNKEWVDTSTLKDPQKTKSLSLTTGCTNVHVGKGKRIVISDAITENGTVPGALWIYKAVSKKSTGKGQTENKKSVAVLLPPRYLSKTKITMTIKEIQDLELNRAITMRWTMKNMKTTLRPKFVRTYPKILLL